MVSSTTRITQLFDRLKQPRRPAFIGYLTAGDPSPDMTPKLVAALERAGVDLIELGVPFSDPIADGPVIQRGSDRALQAGTTMAKVLDIARHIRQTSQVPLVLFSYLNPIIRYGVDSLARDAKDAGIDGLLMTDLSVEEAPRYVAPFHAQGLDTIFLVAPTSTPERLRKVAEYSSGFVYLVSRTGVTGTQDSVSASVEPLINATRPYTKLPLAVGFGISKPEHMAAVGAIADGVIVGSALVRVVEEHQHDADLPQHLEAFARSLAEALPRS